MQMSKKQRYQPQQSGMIGALRMSLLVGLAIFSAYYIFTDRDADGRFLKSIDEEARYIATTIKETGTGIIESSSWDILSAKNDVRQQKAASLSKIYESIQPKDVVEFDRSNPIYIDFGMYDGSDAAFYLRNGYSVMAVEVLNSWVKKARKRFRGEILDHRMLIIPYGVGSTYSESETLYYKNEGSIITSFMKSKGCQMAEGSPRCRHIDVPMIRCDVVLELLQSAPELVRADINMLHHTCIRSLHKIDPSYLPNHVCWEEHDKIFANERGSISRPITDIKLVLGLYELGYNEMKVVVQGRASWSYYGFKTKEEIGHDVGSGWFLPKDMMHFRSYEYTEDGSFNDEWVSVHQVLGDGIFTFGSKPRPSHNAYFDICMKLSDNAATLREQRQNPDNFPLSSYAQY